MLFRSGEVPAGVNPVPESDPLDEVEGENTDTGVGPSGVSPEGTTPSDTLPRSSTGHVPDGPAGEPGGPTPVHPVTGD